MKRLLSHITSSVNLMQRGITAHKVLSVALLGTMMIWPLMMSANKDMVFRDNPWRMVTGTHVIDTIGRGAQEIKVHVRAKGEEWKAQMGEYTFQLLPIKGYDDADDPGRRLIVCRDGLEAANAVMRHCHNGKAKYNSLVVETFRDQMTVTAGDMRLSEPLTLPWSADSDKIFSVFNASPLDVQRISVNYIPGGEIKMYPDGLEALLQRLKDSRDPLEGQWRYFDRNTDPSLALMPSQYTLAISREREGYNIWYLDALPSAGSPWLPGRLKGRLTPRGFQGIYTLQWLDINGQPVADEASATLAADQGLLTLSFPLLNSSLRFTKVQ